MFFVSTFGTFYRSENLTNYKVNNTIEPQMIQFLVMFCPWVRNKVMRVKGSRDHLTLEKGATWRRPDPCTGYVRRVTHDEIADAVGYNSREVLGTPAHPNPKERRNNSIP
jgi:hypothetical protein